MIRRAFADLPHGQLHYRTAGDDSTALPLLVLHPSPGSGRQMVSLVSALAGDRRVLAPDTPGHGDSAPLAMVSPTMQDYARTMLDFLDVSGISRCDVFGSHTGAAIALEMAILAPHRVGRVICEGLGVFSPEQQAQFLEHYAQPFTPDLDGAYLARAFQFCRDQYLFYPWFDRRQEARRTGGLPPPDHFHAWLVEVLKAAETYHLAYRAAFSWPALERLPVVPRPVLMCSAADDPLFDCTRDSTALLADASFAALPCFADPDFDATRRAAYLAFLEG
ncbi:alpha/beta fold hydrolase [Parapedomonas caeni]|jgi:pimeloyl-ACP methyl ester carboxylesterase